MTKWLIFQNSVTFYDYTIMVKYFCLLFTGAISVGEALKKNCTLHNLFLSANIFGDDGVTMIAEGLKHNNILTDLYIDKCGFSVKGIAVPQCMYFYAQLLYTL